MKRYLIILALALSSCTVNYYEDGSMYECGIVIGGEVRGREYWLLVDYPDGRWWHEVTQKAYYEYRVLDDICFDTIVW